VTIGTTLRELERLNGKPFRMFGFWWDYGGEVSSWEGGELEREFFHEAGSQLVVRLGGREWSSALLTEEEAGAVSGEKEVPSDHPVMQKINPEVVVLLFSFAEE